MNRIRSFQSALDRIHHLSSGSDVRSIKHRFDITDNQISDLKSIMFQYPQLEGLKSKPKEWARTFKKVECGLFKSEDQMAEFMIRASKLLEIAQKNDYHRIVYLDGHGRLTACLIDLIYSHGLENSIMLFCVDHTENVNHWHTTFFPHVVQCFHDDVFNLLEEIKYYQPLVYLNFCGFGQCVKETVSLVRESKHLMISFSSRHGKSTSREYDLLVSLIKSRGKQLTDNNRFLTFYLNQEEDQIDLTFSSSKIHTKPKLVIDLTFSSEEVHSEPESAIDFSESSSNESLIVKRKRSLPSAEKSINPRRKRTRKESFKFQKDPHGVYGGIQFGNPENSIDYCRNCDTPIGNIVGTDQLYCEICLNDDQNLMEEFQASKKVEQQNLRDDQYNLEDSFVVEDDEPIQYEDGTFSSDEDSSSSSGQEEESFD